MTSANFNYLEAVKADVKQYLEDNTINPTDFSYYEDADDFAQALNDDLWTVDEVTGNASGSYTFNREEAKNFVLADIETVQEALREFCTPAETIAEKFLEDDWEYFDVTARCYILGQAISEFIEENREAIETAIKEAKEESEA